MLIDPNIRDYVLLPLLVFVAITTFLRMYVFQLLQPGETKVDGNELKQKSLVARSQRLRTNGGYITPQGFAMRKEYLLGGTMRELPKGVEKDNQAEVAKYTKSVGRLREPIDPAAQAPPNPMGSMDMMKMQIVNQFMFMGMFYAIQTALAGFLVVKLPFGLTERFKAITQQGIGVPALDTSFVSSGSWYMIAQSGMQRLVELVTPRRGASSALDEAKMLQMQAGMGPAMMMGGGMGGPQGWQPQQAFQAEASALGVAIYSSQLVDTETDMLARALQAAKAR